jgi:LPXTG-motif cell wall-anchored protein
MAATGANKMNIFYIIGVVVVIVVIAGYLGLHV